MGGRQGKKRVYLDFAAATPLSPRARAAYVRALDLYGNPSAPHEEGRRSRDAIEAARSQIARSLAVKAEELVFTSGGTEANNLAILGLTPRHAVTSTVEHSSVLRAFKILEGRGTRVTYVRPGDDGRIAPETVVRALNSKTDLVTLHHVQSESGTVQPIADIGRAIKKKSAQAVFHVDAAQSPLWLDASPHTLQASLVSYDAQKVMGPKGVGVLWRDYAVPLSPVSGGGTQERGVRPGTENVPAIVGAAVAFEAAVANRKARAVKVAAVRDYLIRKLCTTVPHAVLIGSAKHRVANNVFVAIPGVDGDYLSVLLDKEGIAVTPRSACLGSGGSYSEVALALTGSPELARSTIRLSLSPTVSTSDVDRAVRALLAVLPIVA